MATSSFKCLVSRPNTMTIFIREEEPSIGSGLLPSPPKAFALFLLVRLQTLYVLLDR